MIALLARRLVRIGLAASFLAGIAGAAACSSKSSSSSGDSKAAGRFAKDSSTLVYGVVPDRASVQQNYQPLRDYMEKVSGLKVEYHEAADYPALIEATLVRVVTAETRAPGVASGHSRFGTAYSSDPKSVLLTMYSRPVRGSASSASASRGPPG